VKGGERERRLPEGTLLREGEDEGQRGPRVVGRLVWSSGC
jgi:hypothetical protein